MMPYFTESEPLRLVPVTLLYDGEDGKADGGALSLSRRMPQAKSRVLAKHRIAAIEAVLEAAP